VGILEVECQMASEEAWNLLEAADWDLRVAMVMRQAAVSRETALEALREKDFVVLPAVEALLSRGKRVE
jgi:NACalpha-BTF3-like transcription factor